MSRIVVFIHGFAEGPSVFANIAPALRSDDYDFMFLTLPGHGGTCRDFASTSGSLWLKCVRDAVIECDAKYDDIVLVGHSLGTLLAILSLEHSQKIRGAILINSPLAVRVSMNAVRINLLIGSGKKIGGNSIAYPASQALSVGVGKPWEYIGWLPRLRDLFAYIREAKRVLPTIAQPIMSFHSAHDELIGEKSLRLIRRLAPADRSELIVLDHSTHFDYPNGDIDIMRDKIGSSIHKWFGLAPAALVDGQFDWVEEA